MSKTEFESLIERYHLDSCTDEERVWIENWLNHHKLNDDSRWNQFTDYERAKYIDNLFEDISTKILITKIESKSKIVSLKRRNYLYLITASCAAIIIAIFYFFQNTENKDDFFSFELVELSVPHGKRQKITLSDSTIIYLQGGAKLTYPNKFANNYRSVNLEGEAFFEVTRNEKTPFVVKTKYIEAKVLGTKFHVSTLSEISNTKIYLLEGKLSISSAVDENNELILNSNELAVFDHNENLFEKKKSNINYSLDDFVDGVMKFEDEPLSEIVVKLSNNYGVKIINNTKKQNILVSGLFRREDSINDILKSICITTNTHYKWISKNTAIIQ